MARCNVSCTEHATVYTPHVVSVLTDPAGLVLEIAALVADAVLMVTAVEELHLPDDV